MHAKFSQPQKPRIYEGALHRVIYGSGGSQVLGCKRLGASLLGAGASEDRQDSYSPAGTTCQPAAFMLLCFLIPTEVGVSSGMVPLCLWACRSANEDLDDRGETSQLAGRVEATILWPAF